MLTGTASVDDLARGAPTIHRWLDEPVELTDVDLVQAMFEIAGSSRQAVLPPALHPTNPPTMVLQAWRCGASPWGAFAMVHARVQCRSGLRPRGFVVAAVCDNSDAAAGLAAGWGFRCATDRRIGLARHYDETTVDVEGALRLRCHDPEPLDPGDLSYSSTLNLAHTPNGVRLVQLDASPELTRAERARPMLEHFDADAWGSPLLDARHAVSSSIAVGRLTLAPVRYCCRPDTLAFDGTETVGSATPGS